jgi:hypothetical protein
MTDDERHDEVTRLLREQGPAQAPPDLRDEVMRRVHDEPRGKTTTARRPLLTLLAAALITVALVGGISRIDGGGSSSAGSATTGGSARSMGQLSTNPGTDSGAAGAALSPPATIDNVPAKSLLSVLDSNNIHRDQFAAVPELNIRADVVKLYVPSSKWQQVRVALQQLAQAKAVPDAHRVEVRLYRLPE